jgi:hypothetical protein
MVRVNPVVGFAHHTGVRLAEVGFLLILFAGVWLAVASVPQFKLGTARTIVAGVALAIGGLLLVIATHCGHFYQRLDVKPRPGFGSDPRKVPSAPS